MSVTPRPAPKRLGQVGLARAQVAPQADEVAGARPRVAERAAERGRRRGIGRTGAHARASGSRPSDRLRRTVRGRRAAPRPRCRRRGGRDPASRSRPSPKCRRPAAPIQWPSCPLRSPPRMRTRSGAGIGRSSPGWSNTSIGGSRDDRDLLAGERDEEGHHGRGHRAAGRALHDEDRVGRQPVERRPLPRLRGEEVAPLLAGEPGDDDAADAHRPRPGQRLRVDPRVDDEDRAGEADIEAARAEPAIGPGREPDAPARGTAEGDDAADAVTRGPDRDRGARADVAHDARDRGLDRVDDVAGRDAPAALPLEQVLAADRGVPEPGRDRLAAPRWAAASARPRSARRRPGRCGPRGGRRGAARRSARRRRPTRRIPPARGRPARDGTRRRPGPRSAAGAGTRSSEPTVIAAPVPRPRPAIRRAARAGGRCDRAGGAARRAGRP